MGWRDHLPVHPAADLFPLMSESELLDLGESIKAHGLKSHLKLYRGELLDGRNRLEAMELVGIAPDCSGDVAALACPFDHLNERVDPYDYVIALNLHRRHLTSEQKRELIAKVLKAKPEESNRKIAKQVKADDKTVASVRRDLESTAEIPQLDKTTGADGKKRAKKKARPSWTNLDPATLSALADGTAGDACLMREAAKHHVTQSAEITTEPIEEDHAEVADAATVEDNALHTLARMVEHARIFKKFFKLSTFDRQAEIRISAAIDTMIAKWRSTQSTLTKSAAVATESDAGDIVERCLSLMMAMTKDQRAQFFAKYTELSAARAPTRP